MPNTTRNEGLLADAPAGTQFGVWIGRPNGDALYTHHADAVMPTASSIKAALLIELFAMHEEQLDTPPEGVSEIFTAREHPAFVHYSKRDRQESEELLTKMSVEQLGRQMIRVGENPNRVYNGAANVVIAMLGGPTQATARVHERDDRFAGHTVNRYMLADRNVTGDNTATPESLAAVHSALARREIKGLQPETIERIRNVLLLDKDRSGTSHYFKGGSLGSDPVTYVRAGWWEGKRPTVVYAVMGAAIPDSNETVDAETLNTYVTKLEGRIRQQFFEE
ncbi:class A beta-lactamase-related serine hydrolase [Aeoliella sp. ICT_H6.2]|uniref:Class A beta-lactamase-related serine hydrolase n=1 Tax=Aeoliella straminimaris TaxID=2954799 RepID=A0A9X2F8T9_9BACT|nr:serine hydrolase [Aeoliella straminimaris]MCO6044477.1 class A beta-lactamase-related serine hydrolase [Aeoliella straminimaris]